MINSLYISSHHMDISFIDFIVINFNEVGSHREVIFKSLYFLLAWGWPYTGRNMLPSVYWLTVHHTSVRIVVFDGNKRIELLLQQRNGYYQIKI
jgi:hypothetical protein